MNHTPRFTPVALALATLLAANGGAALAAEAQPAAGNILTVGGGLAVGPRYSGTGQSSTAPVIVFDYSTPGGFFASTLRGLGYLGQAGQFSYSVALGYRGARKEKNNAHWFGNSGSSQLQGMGDINGGASALLSIGYSPLPGFDLSLSADVPLSQKGRGTTLHAAMASQLYARGNEKVSLGLSAGFADSQYAQTYYGVSAQQAGAAKFKAYQAGAGLYETNATVSWEHKIDAHWRITSMVGAARLAQDASHSPLTQRKTAPTAAMRVSYSY